MGLNIQSGVIGCVAIPRFDDDSLSLEELLYGVTRAALNDAGLAIDDIDGIVVAANDQYDGRAISIMAASGSVGGVDRDILSTPSSGEHAFVLGTLRVASGLYRTQLVLAWSPLVAHSLPEVQRLAADPYFHRRLPLDEMASHALQASAIEAKIENARPLAGTIARKNETHGTQAYPELMMSRGINAAAPSLRGPLPDGMTGPTTCGVVAMVIASEDFIHEREIADVAWLRGMGWATEPSFLGDRDLSQAPALAAAAAQAYGDAKIKKPADEIDFAEVAGATPYQELLAYEGLGLCGRADIGARLADGTFSRQARRIAREPIRRRADRQSHILRGHGQHRRSGQSAPWPGRPSSGCAAADRSGSCRQRLCHAISHRHRFRTRRRSMTAPRIGIIGIGQSAFKAHRDDASYPDLVREAVALAITDAGIDFEAPRPSSIRCRPDAMVGIGNAERIGVDAVGARNKRFLRINTGGATGLSSVAAAYYHVAAGACDVVLTAGADKVGECGDSQTVLNKIWDPTYERPLPLGTITMLAMSAVRYMDKYGMTEEGHGAGLRQEPLAGLEERQCAFEEGNDDRGGDGITLHLLAGQTVRLLPAIERRLRHDSGVGTVYQRA